MTRKYFCANKTQLGLQRGIRLISLFLKLLPARAQPYLVGNSILLVPNDNFLGDEILLKNKQAENTLIP